MAKGLLYFAQNPAFQHLTKIGKTTKLEVEDRGLSASNVPEDFQYLKVFKCEDVDDIERKVHNQFEGFRHFASSSVPNKKGRKTEFFWSGCIERAIKYVGDLKGVMDTTDDETEEVEVVDDGERKTRRRTRTTFEMLHLPVGSELHFVRDNSITVKTANKTNLIVTASGDKRTISNYSDELVGGSTSGFFYFSYKGKRLIDIRNELESLVG